MLHPFTCILSERVWDLGPTIQTLDPRERETEPVLCSLPSVVGDGDESHPSGSVVHAPVQNLHIVQLSGIQEAQVQLASG